MFDLTNSIIELLVLSVSKIKLLFSSLDISKQVRLGLVGSLSQPLMQFDVSSLVLNLVLQASDLNSKSLTLLLFLLEAIS